MYERVFMNKNRKDFEGIIYLNIYDYSNHIINNFKVISDHVFIKNKYDVYNDSIYSFL